MGHIRAKMDSEKGTIYFGEHNDDRYRIKLQRADSGHWMIQWHPVLRLRGREGPVLGCPRDQKPSRPTTPHGPQMEKASGVYM
eukprot:5417322-Amphidinium_carterae.1